MALKHPRLVFLLFLLAGTLSAIAAGQTAVTPAPVTASATAQSTQVPSRPEPVLTYSPPPAAYARAKAYSNAHYRHFFIDSFYGLLVLLVLLRWRIAPRLRDLAEAVSSRRSIQLIIFAPLVLLTIFILGIPSDIWDHSLDREFGLSVQTWPSWFTDWIINLIIMTIVGTIFVAIVYAVIRRSPRRWWFYAWLASIPVGLALFFLQPLVVDPLFYTFTPLAETQPVLLSEMQKVMQRGGIEIPPDRMFLMNASSKTTGLNAYVTGYGASKRVVVWDTTVAKATIPETLFVFGHEMGHYVLLHIPKQIAIGAIIVLAMLYVGYRLALLDDRPMGSAVGHSRFGGWGVSASIAAVNRSAGISRNSGRQCRQPPLRA